MEGKIPLIIVEEFKKLLDYPQPPLGVDISKKNWQIYASQILLRDNELKRLVEIWYKPFETER